MQKVLLGPYKQGAMARYAADLCMILGAVRPGTQEQGHASPQRVERGHHRRTHKYFRLPARTGQDKRPQMLREQGYSREPRAPRGC